MSPEKAEEIKDLIENVAKETSNKYENEVDCHVSKNIKSITTDILDCYESLKKDFKGTISEKEFNADRHKVAAVMYFCILKNRTLRVKSSSSSKSFTGNLIKITNHLVAINTAISIMGSMREENNLYEIEWDMPSTYYASKSEYLDLLYVLSTKVLPYTDKSSGKYEASLLLTFSHLFFLLEKYGEAI